MWFATLLVLSIVYSIGSSQTALFSSLPFQWCLPSSTPCKGTPEPAGTKAQFLIGNISKNGTEWIWLDFEVLEPIWMGVGFADSGIGARGQMIGVHGYIDGDFGNGEELQEWQLGNHSLHLKHPFQSSWELIRFEFNAALKQRTVRFQRPRISPDRWDPTINLDGDLCFIWALGVDMNVGFHNMSGQFCARDVSAQPTRDPTERPTYAPLQSNPTPAPTDRPTSVPTVKPGNPSPAPTRPPTHKPTFNPSPGPTFQPTVTVGNPTRNPTIRPTPEPSRNPTRKPTGAPNFKSGGTFSPTTTTVRPTMVPTSKPSAAPSKAGVLSEETTTLAGAAIAENTGLPVWIIPLIVVGSCLCCCFILVAAYLQHRRRQDLEEQRETRSEARKQAARRLAAAKRREEQVLDDEMKPIDIGFEDDKKETTEQPLLGTYADALAGGGGGSAYYGPPSMRGNQGGGLATASRLHVRPVKKSKFSDSTFGDDDDF